MDPPVSQITLPGAVRGEGLRLGRQAWCRWHECRGCVGPLQFQGHDAAVRWLQGTGNSPSAMADLRRALASAGGDFGLSRATDREVISRLASLIVSHRVQVCGAAVPAPDAPLDPPPSPYAEGPAPEAVAQPAPPPQEEPELDVAAIVAGMVAAAAQGIPFCEECERAREQQAQAAA